MLSMIWPVLMGACLGALLGYFGQCTSGTCPLTSTWWRGAIYGGVMGLIFAGVNYSGQRASSNLSGTPVNSSLAGNTIAHVDADRFDAEVVQSKVPVVVDFYAPWCGPCKAMAPMLENLAQEYGGKAKFLKVNVDEAPGLANRFNIRGVPTLIFFKNGDRQNQLVGMASAEELKRQLEVLIGSTGAPQTAGIR